MMDPLTGKPYIVTLPDDMWRNYDEAVVNMYHMRLSEGLGVPRLKQSGSEGPGGCVGDSYIGLLRGFAFGLQYDNKTPGKCYLNLDNSILAIDQLSRLFILVFLPEKTPKVILATQDMVTVLSTLYGNCQIQVLF